MNLFSLNSSGIPEHSEGFAQFQNELEAVDQNLVVAANDLAQPLDELVRSTIAKSSPLLRAAVVLAAGYEQSESHASPEKRIHLASAFEMLYVALSLHKLLLPSKDSSQENSTDSRYSIDDTLLGAVILAGDYCFSQSASMVTRTDDPIVVGIFADALKIVSERQLRHLFGRENELYDANLVLFESGADAASRLVQLPVVHRTQTINFAQQLAQFLDGRSMIGETNPVLDLTQVVPIQKERWKAIIQHIQHDATNGKVSI